MKSIAIFLKSLRLQNNDERLSDMAQRLDISASYLSTIETEKRRMNDKLFDKLVHVYRLDDSQAKKLNVLRNLASDEIVVPLNEMTSSNKELMAEFLSNLDELSPEDFKKIDLMIKSKKS